MALEVICSELLARLRLTTEGTICDTGDSFVTLRCRNETGSLVVLKYVSSGSLDAYRRLKNEALLLQHLPVRPPLRLLRLGSAGPGYLVTELDPGILLRPEDLHDRRVFNPIADALIEFQAIRTDVGGFGIVDREHMATYYLKVLLKHILHLWPAHLSAQEAASCMTIVTTSLPAILRTSVICHGDFLPSNLLFHPDDGTVTVTDLEGFMSRNHPLFDVMALFTMNDLDLARWDWQPLILLYYLEKTAGMLQLDPASREFNMAYRGVLISFLVYRLNEARIDLQHGAYFDGRGKRDYVVTKLIGLLQGHPELWRDEKMREALEVRKSNLRRMLSVSGYDEHLERMLAYGAS
jgi:hypothetical protein